MATNIDERIVAAKFDASDFEKGVDKTIKKLDELKKGLDFKDATKGVKELAEKTQASTDSMSKSLDKLTERFTTFFGMIKQKLLSGLADEVVGVFFKMEQGVKSFIKSISTDQVSYGMSKYEQMLTSVRTMMAAGESEGAAYTAIGTLRDYSDQTSYSLSQMTDALSKLRAAGVDLDTATKSVEGIANACANAGINATDAQRAFFNLSQAYSSGVLKYTDYRSLELLNMTTEKFKENILEAAVNAGTLKKVSEGVYQTINKNNKKVTAGKKVTKQNLQDMLRYNFVTSEVMNELFGGTFFFDEDKFKEYKKKYATLDEAIAAAKKDYGETAVNAYLAAREARSFTDVMNTLKDVVSTGWSTTFEYLFGKLGEAKDFFTELAEVGFADVIYKIGEYRNAVLEIWNGDIKHIGGGEVFRQTILNISDALGTLLRTVFELLPGFSELYKTEDQLEKEGTPVIDSIGDKLYSLTMRIRDVSLRIKQAANDFHSFMNEEIFKGGPTRIELLRKTFSNLFSVFSIAGKVVGIALNGIGKAFQALHPIFDNLIIVLSKVTEPLTNLNKDTKVFNDLEYTIDNICNVLEPVAKFLGEILGFVSDIAGFIAQMALDTFTANISFFADTLGLIFELITGNSAQMKAGEGILDGMRKDFEGIKEACVEGYEALKTFFGALLGDIRQLFGLTEEADKQNQNGGVFSGLTNFFDTNEFVQKAKKWVNQAIVDVGEFIKSIPSRIRALGVNIYTTLRGLFFTEEKVKNGDKEETKEILTPLGQWCDQAIKDIKEFFASIPKRIIDGVGQVTNWIDEVFNYWFGSEKATNRKDNKNNNKEETTKNTTAEYDSRFTEFVNNAKIAISEWFNDLPNKIKTAFANVGNFVTNLYNALDEFLFGKKVRQTISVADGKGGLKYKDITVRYKSGFSKWLDGVIKDIKKFISNIPEYIKKGIRGAGDIITTIIAALFGRPENEKVTSKDISEELAAPFLGIDIGALLTEIQNIGKEILNQIARIFTGTDDIDSNMNWFSEKIAVGINWIRDKALEALTWLTSTLASIPTTIANLFTGKEDEKNPNKGPIGTAISNFGSTIGKFITETLPEKILEFIKGSAAAFDTIWTSLYNTLIGTTAEASSEASENVVEETTDALSRAAKWAKDHKNPTAWEKFVKNLGETIGAIWQDLPVWIANGIELAIKGVNEIIANVGDWIGNLGGEQLQESAKDKAKKWVDKLSKGSEEGSDDEEPRLVTAIKGIGERIKELFVKIIPGFITDAWKAISALGEDLYVGISSIFSEEGLPEDSKERQQMIYNVGMQVKNWLKNDLPGYIQPVWAEISKKASEIFEGIASIFTGKVPESEVGKAVKNLGEKIYNTITVQIPSFIKRAFDYIGNLFAKRDPVQETLDRLPDSERAYVSRYIAKMQKDTKDATSDAEKPSFWGFISGIGDGLLEAFSNIGPGIINGIASALDWISNIADIIIDALTGKKTIADQVDETYEGQKPELKNALIRIGESLKNFFLDTLPKFIGSAIGTLQREAPKWFEKLFGAMTEAAKAEGDKSEEDLTNTGEEKIETAVEGASGVLGVIMNMIENLKKFVGENKDIIEIAVVFIALTMVFRALSDLFSVSRVTESGADIIKWTAITVAVAAIAGILSYIGTIVNENNPEKLKNFNDILDKLNETLKMIAGIVALFSVGKLFDALGSFGSTTITEKFGGGGIFGAVSSLLGGIFVGGGIGLGASLAGAGISAGIDSIVSTISDSFTQLSSSVDTALVTLEPTIDKLSSLYDKIDKAKESIVKIKGLFEVFIQTFESLYEDSTGNELLKNDVTGKYNSEADGNTDTRNKVGASMELYIEALHKRMELFLDLSVFLNELSNALNKMPDAPDISSKLNELDRLFTDGTMANFFTNVFNVLKSVVETGHFSPELLGAKYEARLSGMSLALDMLADSFRILGDGMSGLDEDKVKAMGSIINVFSDLSTALGVVGGEITDKPSWLKVLTGDNSLSKVASEFKLFGIDMKAFFDQVSFTKGFKPEEIAHTEVVVRGMTNAVKMIADATASITLYELDQVIEDLPEFGIAIGQFFNSLDEGIPKDISTERVSAINSIVEAVSSVISAVSDISEVMSEHPTLDISMIFDRLWESFGANNTAKRAGVLSKITAIIDLFYQAINNSLISEENAQEYDKIGETLAVRLINSIQKAIDSDPTLKITPVLNLDTAEQQLRSMFGIEDLKSLDFKQLYGAAAGSNDQVDEDRVKWSVLGPKIDEVSVAINTLTEAQPTLNDLIDAFSKLKMYINKDTLVGEIGDSIDRHIGMKIDLLNNNVSV